MGHLGLVDITQTWLDLCPSLFKIRGVALSFDAPKPRKGPDVSIAHAIPQYQISSRHMSHAHFSLDAIEARLRGMRGEELAHLPNKLLAHLALQWERGVASTGQSSKG